MNRFLFALLFTSIFCVQPIFVLVGQCQTLTGSNDTTRIEKFEPTWTSLAQYEIPEWFRNAKFGIWAHWGPQCQPEQGDWYGRFMYHEGSEQYKWHIGNYGHPSQAGFKEVIRDWKAEKWNPDKLVALYKRAGAQYFFAMANHHDNLDLWASKHHEWNSVRVGPKKDIVGQWAVAARKYGLPLGLSVHASHAWTWFETSQRADKNGPLAGVPYDGKATKADGKGKWWEGLDPQALYAQSHTLSSGSDSINSLWKQWDWGNGASKPSEEYFRSFYDRTVDLIDQFDPDLLYFDDTVLPFYPVSDVGLKVAAYYYNHNLSTHGNKLEAVLFGKILNEEQKKCLVWDVERGALDSIQEKPWQTCTCIGDWHYRRSIFENDQYKSAAHVIHMLVDIVSKNGNLLLNIPVRGDGTIDEKEIAILEQIAGWMDINKESIFDTRPWTTFGEGPSSEKNNPMNGPGFNEGKLKYNATDIRYNKKGNILYATVLGPPQGNVFMTALGKQKSKMKVKKVELLGSQEKIAWRQSDDKLSIQSPATIPNDIAAVFKIELQSTNQ